MSRTKIVATIGPASASPNVLRALSEAGMTMARLNGSHATLDWHADTIAMVRRTLPDVPILLDIPGRKIRTARLEHEPEFAAGDAIVLTTDSREDGRRKVPVNYARLHEDLQPGNTILADDGTLRFTVVSVDGRDIICRAEVAGTLRSAKGINVPFVSLRTPLVTDRDRAMIKFAREHRVDFIGVSFVESAAHVQAMRELIGDSWPRIVAKVENQGGVKNLDEIAAASDALMIDRGDLSVETDLNTLVLMQKRIIEGVRRFGKPVIVATEMLHTMIENPFPTKAEVSDITNAVIDGCAATMLSGETAIGANPLAAVRLMRAVADAADSYLQDDRGGDGGQSSRRQQIPEAFSEAIGLLCRRLPISKVVAVTRSGYAARMVATQRPAQPILAVSDDEMAARSFNLLPGTEGVWVDFKFPRKSADHVPLCLKALWQKGKLSDDDLVLVTAVSYPYAGSRMNLLETHVVADLRMAFNWDPARPAFNPGPLDHT